MYKHNLLTKPCFKVESAPPKEERREDSPEAGLSSSTAEGLQNFKVYLWR